MEKSEDCFLGEINCYSKTLEDFDCHSVSPYKVNTYDSKSISSKNW